MATPTAQELMALPAAYMAEVNPSSHQLYNSAIGFIVVDTIIFGLFVASMYLQFHREKFAVDIFVLIPVSYLAVLGTAIIGLFLVTMGGVGRHISYHLLNDPTIITKYLQLQTGVEIVYMAAITFPKIAILTLYLKIFTGRFARGLTWAMGALLVMFFLSGLTLALAICKPYRFKWNKTINGTCGDIMAGYRWISIPSIITDFFILVIPIPTIWKLHVDKYKKAGLFATFVMGSLGLITAIIRCLTFYRLDLFADPTYLAGETMAWTIVESSAYFICACLPRLRPLLQLFLEKTGLNTAVSNTFRTVGHKSRGTQNGTVASAKHQSAGHSGFSSHTSEDKIGFVQMDELRHGSPDGHLHSHVYDGDYA